MYRARWCLLDRIGQNPCTPNNQKILRVIPCHPWTKSEVDKNPNDEYDYMQLDIPSDVPIAVRMVMTICKICFQVSFFICFNVF